MTSAEYFEAYAKPFPNASTLTIQAARHMPAPGAGGGAGFGSPHFLGELR
jgi:hypothetical protein